MLDIIPIVNDTVEFMDCCCDPGTTKVCRDKAIDGTGVGSERLVEGLVIAVNKGVVTVKQLTETKSIYIYQITKVTKKAIEQSSSTFPDTIIPLDF